MTRKAVQDALRKLEADGDIACTGTTKSGTRIYSILGIDSGENPGDESTEGRSSRPAGAKSTASRGVETTPDPLDDPVKDPLDVDVVARAWGKHAPPLIAHGSPYFKAKRFATAVRAARQTYELDAILKAIENYATVLSSPSHFFTWRYSAVDFLRRDRATPGVEKFVDEAVPLENFRTKRDDDRDGKQQRTPSERLASAEAWILNTAWRQPIEEWDLAEQLGQRGVEGPDRERLLELWRSKRDLAA